MASSKKPADPLQPVREVQQAICSALSELSTELSPELNQTHHLVGFSGGLDSTVLLHASVAVLGPGALTAVHVNHGLQSAAEAWASQCEAVAGGMSVNFQCENAQARPAQFPDGLENWARDQRRDAFLRAAREIGTSTLLLAHHRNDQAETVLWHLARGAGPDGIAGMRTTSQRDGLLVVRPLLGLAQSTLREYAAHFDLPVIEDQSNAHTFHTRNRIRHEVMPQLNDSFPGFDLALARAASNAADVTDALRLALFDGEPPVELSRTRLQSCPPVLARQMLRLWLQAKDVAMPDRRTLFNWLPRLIEGENAYVQIDHAGDQVCRYRDRILLRRDVQIQSRRQVDSDLENAPQKLHWNGETVIDLPQFDGQLQFTQVSPGELGVSADRLVREALSISPLRMSARIRPRVLGRSRQIRRLCQEHAIARWERSALPMLWLGEIPLFVARVGMNADCLKPVTSCDDGVRVQWRPHG